MLEAIIENIYWMKSNCMAKLQINLKELESDREKNFEERLKFIDMLVDHIKSVSDEQWSGEQKTLIDKKK